MDWLSFMKCTNPVILFVIKLNAVLSQFNNDVIRIHKEHLYPSNINKILSSFKSFDYRFLTDYYDLNISYIIYDYFY